MSTKYLPFRSGVNEVSIDNKSELVEVATSTNVARSQYMYFKYCWSK